MIKNKILGASIGNCIHICGVINFLNLARKYDYETKLLGPAIKTKELTQQIIKEKPTIVALSYRLSPQPCLSILKELKLNIDKFNLKNIKFIFAGTKETANTAERLNIFEKVFDGTEGVNEIIKYLTSKNSLKREFFADNLIDRIKNNVPYPLLRHHFGLPSLKETIGGVREIAKAKVLDVLSIAPDQNAQEHFFRKNEINGANDGAGGVPIRGEEDLITIYNAIRCGNYPLIRIYSGTQDLIKWAELAVKTINNAWAAIPLFWYNVLDKRSPRKLTDSIKENQSAIRWYAERGIPVEINDAHQWSLRYAHDTIAIAIAYLSAYNAKKLGVKNYVAQFMFNTPPAISPAMDLAKMLAKIELIRGLEDKNFKIIRQARTGLAYLSSDLNIAKGQLSTSIILSLTIKPHIIHIVGFSEGSYQARTKEVIESCKIVKGIIESLIPHLNDLQIIKIDDKIRERKQELIQEALILIEAIKNLDKTTDDPLCNYKNLAKAVRVGLLDAPHLKGNKYAKGILITEIIDGACYAIDKNDKILIEKDRIKSVKV